MARPVIAILSETQLSVYGRPEFATHQSYFEAIWQAGGYPVLLPNLSYEELITDFPFAGLLCTGGRDISPSRYGETAHAALGEIDEQRDWLESRLIEKALEEDIPLLCICRGMQMLNVVRSGSLYQDLASQRPSKINHDNHEKEPFSVAHLVEVAADSLLGRIVQSASIPMNSRHHQAIKECGSNLQVSATAPDGLIEAIEAPAQRFALGLQGHPEDLIDSNAYAVAIFKAFVQTAEK